MKNKFAKTLRCCSIICIVSTMACFVLAFWVNDANLKRVLEAVAYWTFFGCYLLSSIPSGLIDDKKEKHTKAKIIETIIMVIGFVVVGIFIV